MANDQPDFDALVGCRSGRDLPPSSSPRPYLHPVRSLAGVSLTEAAPTDHPHHAALSIAFSDLNGTNFWGGSTYTASGPAMLANHGRQEAANWTRSAADSAGTVTWFSEHGAEVAIERRSIRCYPHPAGGTWSLSIHSVMHPGGDVARLEVSSSAVKGRTGAGYGGIFWRFPGHWSVPHILFADGDGAASAHGSCSPWLAVSATEGKAPISVVLAQDGSRPWFIRSNGYLGAGPAVAWSEKAFATTDRPLVQHLAAVIHDGHVSTDTQALELLQHHPEFQTFCPDRTP